MGTTNTRRYKIEWMAKAIHLFFSKKPKDTINIKKLIAMFALETASTERTGQEIIKLMADAGKIKIKDGEIIR